MSKITILETGWLALPLPIKGNCNAQNVKLKDMDVHSDWVLHLVHLGAFGVDFILKNCLQDLLVFLFQSIFQYFWVWFYLISRPRLIPWRVLHHSRPGAVSRVDVFPGTGLSLLFSFKLLKLKASQFCPANLSNISKTINYLRMVSAREQPILGTMKRIAFDKNQDQGLRWMF